MNVASSCPKRLRDPTGCHTADRIVLDFALHKNDTICMDAALYHLWSEGMDVWDCYPLFLPVLLHGLADELRYSGKSLNLLPKPC